MDMAISGISGLGSITPLFDSTSGLTKVAQPEAGNSFSEIFASAIDNVRVTDADKNEKEYLLAVGELDNPAELTIASTKAQVAVELLTTLRTKALEAHGELMRMSI